MISLLKMKPSITTFIYFIIIFVSCCYASKTKIIKASEVKVEIGSHKCISDCTYISANNNRTMFCSIHECGKLEISGSTAQSPEIEKVYLERYVDELEDRLRLALRVEWSPVDNVSLERTKGYVVNITDGKYSYSTCYNITSKMDFHDNGHDIFYNDCFGKVKGTFVTPGANISVYIGSLPMWEGGIHDGSVALTVRVPDCTNSKLHQLKECEIEGGRPTTRSCATDCDTYSTVGDNIHPISCTLSKRPLTLSTGPEKCADVNKTLGGGTPSPPKHISKQQEWYKYTDSKGDVKLALNFSWMPGPDASMEKIHAYHLVITPGHKSDLTNFNKCFAIHTVLEEPKHSNAEFFYDCYGRLSVTNVEPAGEYLIHLNSIPQGRIDTKETFTIELPNCAERSMQDVTYCQKENNRFITSKVEDIFCSNRSVKYTYSVSKEYGKLANVVFCERGTNLRTCKVAISEHENLPPKGTLYDISLSSAANLSINYTIYVEGVDIPYRRSMVHPDFSKCVTRTPAEVSSEYIVITVILVIGIMILVGVVFLFCFTRNQRCSLLRLKRLRGQPTPTQDPDNELHKINRDQPVLPHIPQPQQQPPVQVPATIPESGSVRVYVVFADDHYLHKEVVHWFCSYLKSDLGLDVRLSEWELNTAAVNRALYMTSNLQKANKVVVICSEGTKDCLEKKEYDGNMFAPVVRNICQQSFIGQNPGKFLVGYFDYSKPEHVPDLLHDQCLMYFSLFKLMKQFEPFYFRLVEIEQYQEGGIQRIDKIAFDRYHEPELTNCGMKLKESIDRMTAFVQENPTWYTDQCGEDMAGADLPEPPRTRPVAPRQPHPIREMDPDLEGQASISYLHMSAPPEIPNNHLSSGARPKVINNPPMVPNPPPPQPMPQREPPMHVPRPVVKRVPYEQLSSALSSNTTDESFVVDEKETQDLMSLSYPVHPAAHPHPQPAEHDDYSGIEFHQPGLSNEPIGYNHSYQPESFHLDDPLESENSLLSNMPSNETQITRIGLTDSMVDLPKVLEEENLISIDPIGSQQIEIPRSLGESGVFTLAQVDDNDDDDIEDQFKSINLSGF